MGATWHAWPWIFQSGKGYFAQSKAEISVFFAKSVIGGAKIYTVLLYTSANSHNQIGKFMAEYIKAVSSGTKKCINIWARMFQVWLQEFAKYPVKSLWIMFPLLLQALICVKLSMLAASDWPRKPFRKDACRAVHASKVTSLILPVKEIILMILWLSYLFSETCKISMLKYARQISLLNINLWCHVWHLPKQSVNTLRLRQDSRHLAHDIFKCIFFNENCCILIQISLKYVPKGPINNYPALGQIMAWRIFSTKPLSELMMAYFSDA